MVYPNMVLQLIPTGLLGIMLAALLSALTSTLSAILNSTSTLFTMDFYAQYNKKAGSKKLVIIGKSPLALSLSLLPCGHLRLASSALY